MNRKGAFVLVFGIAFWVAGAADAVKAPKSEAAKESGRGLCDENFGNYRETLHRDPDDSQAWQELRVCAELLKRWGEAGAIATAAIDRGVRRPEPHMILGMAHYRLKDYNAALDDFKDAIKLKDDNAMAYFQLG
jgi:tetratricopeptide (TPR) repeat protein